MIQLIANPAEYEGKEISVRGWFELYKLFPTKEFFAMRDLASTVDLAEPTEDGDMTINCELKYVEVHGTFIFDNFVPTIAQVTRVYDIEANEFCWQLESN